MSSTIACSSAASLPALSKSSRQPGLFDFSDLFITHYAGDQEPFVGGRRWINSPRERPSVPGGRSPITGPIGGTSLDVHYARRSMTAAAIFGLIGVVVGGLLNATVSRLAARRRDGADARAVSRLIQVNSRARCPDSANGASKETPGNPLARTSSGFRRGRSITWSLPGACGPPNGTSCRTPICWSTSSAPMTVSPSNKSQTTLSSELVLGSASRCLSLG